MYGIHASEWVVAAAVRLGSGDLFSGPSHIHAVQHVLEAGKRIDNASDAGFVNNAGKFLTRSEAYAVALRAGQIKPNDALSLASEDMYGDSRYGR